MANTQFWYFGDAFGREWSTPGERITDEDEVDPQAYWYATEDETCDGIIDLYRGAAGLRLMFSNFPEHHDWAAYVAKLTALAERY